jgi:glycosyltransferase involved in cell wall biosynthesis
MPVLYFDTTKARRQGHHSGLNRVSSRLLESFRRLESVECRPVYWSTVRGGYRDAETGSPVPLTYGSCAFFTPEVFALRERTLSRRWMKRFTGTSACMFYDAIPWKRPETTWPRSVRRFPHWFRDLAAYRKAVFISGAAREDAREVARETGMPVPEGPVLVLGADYRDREPDRSRNPAGKPVLLNVGILEPRKGQAILLEAAERLWAEGSDFQVVFLGRVNPHFGASIERRIHELQAQGRDIVHEPGAGDDRLAHWHRRAALTVLPSRAEGFGLPVLESLWAGCPVLCSEQPSLEVLSDRSGIEVLDQVDAESLAGSLRGFLKDRERLANLSEGIVPERLPRWDGAARQLSGWLFS